MDAGNAIDTLPDDGWVLVELDKPILGTPFHTYRCGKAPVVAGRFLHDVGARPVRWWELPESTYV